MTTVTLKTRYASGEARIAWRKYSNGRPAITLVDAETSEPILTASVNLPELPIEDGWVFIKNYSENEGVLETLAEAGIIEDTGTRIYSGHVEIPICRLLVDPE